MGCLGHVIRSLPCLAYDGGVGNKGDKGGARVRGGGLGSARSRERE